MEDIITHSVSFHAFSSVPCDWQMLLETNIHWTLEQILNACINILQNSSLYYIIPLKRNNWLDDVGRDQILMQFLLIKIGKN